MKRVLLVDDDSFALEIYSKLLKEKGYVVDVANNVDKALEKIANNCPDLLILDLNLDKAHPGPKDGLDILKKIRQNQRTKNLKVIVISNYSEKNYPELSGLSYLGVTKSFLKVQTGPEEMAEEVKEILK